MSSRIATRLGAIFRDAMIPVNGRASNLVSNGMEMLLMKIGASSFDLINFPSRQPDHTDQSGYPCRPDELLTLPRHLSPL